MKKLLFLCVSISFAWGAITTPVMARETPSCYKLYGGGVTTNQYCPKPPIDTSTKKTTHQQAVKQITSQIKTQTKGGQTIYPITKAKVTPETGPELWMILGLLPLAGCGFFLRNKANI
jgi:hypothetical protein